MSSLDQVREKLKAYKKKYYVRQTFIGALSWLILSLTLFLFLGYLEYELWMSSQVRSILFFASITILLVSFFFLFLQPLLKVIKINKGITDETAASDIAAFFPEIEDRLLNVIQLGGLSSSDNNLVTAAIEEKSKEFRSITFSNAVDFSIAKKYLLILGSIVICFFLLSFINPGIVSDSPKRIANFNQEFERESPFQFHLLNESLDAFKGEDFVLKINVTGSITPEMVYLLTGNDAKIPLVPENGVYSFTYPRIQSAKKFKIEAAGFRSKEYTLSLIERPDLISMNISIENPQYTGGERQVVSNTGDITIAEGSQVRWDIEALSTNIALLLIHTDSFPISRISQNRYAVEKRLFRSGSYRLVLKNNFSVNKSELSYTINVIKDLFPKITAEFFPDSATYQYITFAGSITDDYGFSSLTLNYRKNGELEYQTIPLEINPNSKTQSFYANWALDSLNLKAGNNLEIFISVADNDQVNGAKSSRSQTFIFQIPTEDEINSLLSNKSEVVKNQLDKAKADAESISDKLTELQDRLRSEQKFEWQEKKLLADVLSDREKLTKQIEDLQKKHQELQKSNRQFKRQSSQLQDKNEKMQQLLDELMDEETRKLYEKLKELMKENSPQDQISEQLEQLTKNESNLERDLERAVELFKRLKMESALEQNLQKLDTLSTQQESVAKKNTDDQSPEQSKLDQESIQEQFDEFRKQMDQVQEMNQDLAKPEAMEDFEYEERQIAKELREIMEDMKQDSQKADNENTPENTENKDQNSPPDPTSNEKKATEQQRKAQQQKQQNAAKQMKELSKKLSNMQGGMQMEMMQANLDELRDILDNLVKLSFNQEQILLEMREVNQSDPRFLELSQNQLKLRDDAKVIQDSLLSLASKVVQISSFVTKEVSKINESIEQTLDQLKERNRSRALTGQQFAMTSINNLALLLDDTMQQMQMAMSEAMGNNSGEKKQSQGMPDMQELQNQLGESINELKGSGRTGRKLSEELARLAAEQEMIRRRMEMLKEAEDGKPGGGKGGDDLKKAIELMEQNEVDLVNKRLTQQLINRQQQIQTRLLEAEKAQKEQESEEEREATKPSIISRQIPPEFEEYLKLKKKEIELLKTIPIELNPFYKKEVNDYFRRISTVEQE